MRRSGAQFLPASVTRARDNFDKDIVSLPLDAQPEYPSEAAVFLTGFFDKIQVVAVKEGLDKSRKTIYPSKNYAHETTALLHDIAFTYTGIQTITQKKKLGQKVRHERYAAHAPSGDRSIHVLFSLNGLGQDIESKYPDLDEKTKLELLQTGINVTGVCQDQSVSALSPNGLWTDQQMTLGVAGHYYLTSYTSFFPGDIIEAVPPDRATLEMLPKDKNRPTPSAVKLFLQPKRAMVFGERLKTNMERMIIQPPPVKIPELLPWHAVAKADSDHMFLAFAALLTELRKAKIINVSFGEKAAALADDDADNDTFIAQLAYMFGMIEPDVAVDSELHRWRQANNVLADGLKRQASGRLWKSERIPGNLAYGFDPTERTPNNYIAANGKIDKSQPVGALLALQLSSVGRYVEAVADAFYMDHKNVVGHVTVPIDTQTQVGDRSVGVLLV